LRWIPTKVVAGEQTLTPTVSIPFLQSSKLDEFFMRVGGQLHQHGYTVVERLMPPGFALSQQPVYRYRKGIDPSPVLFQAGDGIFSIHAVPPYHSWEQFHPLIEQGINALLVARDDSHKNLPFARVSLRYIDAFTEELRAGLSAAEFISKILGISIAIPRALGELLKSGASPEYGLQIGLPSAGGTVLNLNIAEASVNGKPAVLMDTTFACTQETAPEFVKIRDVLTTGHTTMHKLFLELTRPIHGLMQPSQAVQQ
jgi:uncharacterized protein (TIGR04255 family)